MSVLSRDEEGDHMFAWMALVVSLCGLLRMGTMGNWSCLGVGEIPGREVQSHIVVIADTYSRSAILKVWL